MKKICIGAGAGFGNDRYLPAVDLLRDGELDFLCLECLAERTVAMAQQQRLMDPNMGYNSYLVRRMAPLLPLAYEKHGFWRLPATAMLQKPLSTTNRN